MLPAQAYQGLLAFEKKEKVHLFWRALEPSTRGIFSFESTDGKTFHNPFSFIALHSSDGSKIVLGKQPALRASALGAKTVLTFSIGADGLAFATGGRDGDWKVIAISSLFDRATILVKLPPKAGKKALSVAFSSRNSRVIFQAKTSAPELNRWRDAGDVLSARRNRFDASNLSPLYTALIPQGILLVYSAKTSAGQLAIGAALFDRDEPSELLWRSDTPLWEAPEEVSSEAALLGGVNIGKYFFIYLQSPGKEIERFPMARYWEAIQKNKPSAFVLPPRKKGTRIILERLPSNPVLEPIAKNAWEAFATFNPAAITLDGRVHLLYRAQGYDGLSVLGYASSSDGIKIDERDPRPAFVPGEATAQDNARPYPYVSGGGTGGCEDPRLVEINNRVYLMYVAYDGCNPPGVALSHISTADFLAKRWRWTRPKLISRPGQIQKNWVLFPEKINGRYALIHGLSPKIKIEYIDDPKVLGDGNYIESLSSHGGSGYVEAMRLGAWDNIVRGVGAPPLKTKYGWLIFYHGMDMRDPGKYKVGVMLLDLEHPEIILRRAIEPVLEPETEYENSGHKRGVVYVCGAVSKDGKLFVYYGASDRTSAVAMADLETFLQSLLKEEPPVLTKMNTQKIS
ncbi:MAG: hypothetical protein ACEQSB_02480 [Undibacterium sp.]